MHSKMKREAIELNRAVEKGGERETEVYRFRYHANCLGQKIMHKTEGDEIAAMDLCHLQKMPLFVL